MLNGAFKVFIAGNDVTNRWAPTLLSVSVSRGAREASDTAEATLADPDGLTYMPETGADLIVHLGHVEDGVGQVFEGFVDTVKSRGGKGAGRTISISGSSVDNKSKVKAPGLRSASDKTFADVAKEWGSKAGLQVSIAGDLAKEFRPYWLMQHESFIGWGQRMARELGASFKVIGNRGFFAPLNEGISASGQQLSPVYGTWGFGLIDWDISPIKGRPQYGKVQGRHYDINSAKWREVEQLVKDAKIDVDFRALLGSANEVNAKQLSKSAAKDSEREKGEGSVTIIGDYAAEPEAQFILKGAREGIDGTYTIDSLTHSLSKGDGFTTALTLKHPTGGVGKDTR